MGSRMVYDCARELGKLDFTATRFNYRGVGRSAGVYGGGDGEVEDAIAVHRFCHPDILLGCSFGGGVATRLAATHQPERLVLVAAPHPVRESTLNPAVEAPEISCPVDFIVGDHDPFVPLGEAEALAEQFPDCTLHIIDDCGHFLVPDETTRLAAKVCDVLNRH